MIVKSVLYFLFGFLLLGCNTKPKDSKATTLASANTDKVFVSAFPVSKFEGSYSGSFDRGFITIVLNYVQGSTASGYDIQRGLRRNINGKLSPGGKSFSFLLKEPGDNVSDGIFQFTIDTSKFILNGAWKPHDTLNILSRPLVLKRQPKKNEQNYENDLGTWIPATGNYSTDTTLDFSGEGICEFRFYQFPGDSTSQLLSVKGSYIRENDSVLIDWQKNTWTPAQKMKLVIFHKKTPGDGYDEQRLVGSGWKMIKLEGD